MCADFSYIIMHLYNQILSEKKKKSVSICLEEHLNTQKSVSLF